MAEVTAVGNGPVARRLASLLADGPVHMTLIDPASSPGKAGERIAHEATAAGSHAIMIGGSTDVTQENADALVDLVRAATDLPLIYFPSSAGAMPAGVDALWFLSTLNSTDPRCIVGEQARGAPFVLALGVEPLGLGYIIVEPGMKVGAVSRAAPVARSDDGVARAVGLALAARFFGMPYVYLEAGSGAPSPVPADMVRAVRGVAGPPLIVGGGIRDAAAAARLLDAGADVLVTGTVAENGHFDRLREIVAEVARRRRGAAPPAQSE